MKNINNKGYTLIELLTAIIVLSLVLGISTYGIINLINSSKNKASLISESGIKESASMYSEEASSNSWIYPQSGGNYEYYCVTIDELINKGLIAKKAILPDGIEKTDYVTIKRNRVTFVKNEAVVLSANADKSSIEYSICTGNTIKENVTIMPLLGNSSSYTDEINVSFTDLTAESNITNTECYYNRDDSYIPMNDNKGIVKNNTCILSELEKKQIEKDYVYYIKICMTTEKGSILCSKPSSYTTAEFIKPTISYVNNSIKVSYDDTNVKKPYHYFKSNANGTSNNNAYLCDDTFNCSNSGTKSIEKDKWYKVNDNNISISYNDGIDDGKIFARITDGTGNYSESIKNFVLYKVTFFKGNADKIGSSTSDVIKYCIVDKGKNCSMTSPTITKVGSKIIGWNTISDAIGSTWNVGVSKNITSSSNYYPITSNEYNVTLDDQGATNKGTEKVTAKYNEAMPQIKTPERKYNITFNYNISNQPDETKTLNYKFDGYYDARNGGGTKYYNGTGTSAKNWNKTSDTTLYAKWISQGITLPEGERSGYTLKGWYTNNNCDSNYKAGDAGTYYTPTSNTVLYACWRKNQVFIKYNPNGGNLNGGSDFTIGSNGNILKNGNENIQALDFDGSLTSDGLYNYNNSSYINITKNGYTAMKGKEWQCLSDNCIVDYYSQDMPYDALDICDATDGDCTVTLGVNWIKNKTYKYIDYYLFNLMKSKDDIINSTTHDAGYSNSANFMQVSSNIDDTSGKVCIGEENDDNCIETWELEDFYNNYKAIRENKKSNRFIVPNGGKASISDSYYEEYLSDEQEENDEIVVTSYHISEVWYRKSDEGIESGRGYDYSKTEINLLIDASVIPTGSGTINGSDTINGTAIERETAYPYGIETLPPMFKFTVKRIIIENDLNNKTPVDIEGTKYYFAPAVYKVVSKQEY